MDGMVFRAAWFCIIGYMTQIIGAESTDIIVRSVFSQGVTPDSKYCQALFGFSELT